MRSMCGADAGCSATNYQSLYAGMGTHLGEGQARCSGSEAGSYSRPTDFVYQSTLGLRVIKKKKNDRLGEGACMAALLVVHVPTGASYPCRLMSELHL